MERDFSIDFMVLNIGQALPTIVFFQIYLLSNTFFVFISLYWHFP